MLTDKPAVKIVIPFAVGIILSKLVQLPISITFYIGGLLLILLLGSIVFKRYNIFNISLIILLTYTGFVKYWFDSNYNEKNRIDKFINREDVFAIKGWISDPPVKKTKYIQFVIEVDTVYTSDSVYCATGGVQVYISAGGFCKVSLLKYGNRIMVISKLYGLREARNPGEFDMKNFLEANDIFARIMLENDHNIVECPTKEVNVLSLIYSLRSLIAQKIENEIGGVEATFLKGIIIGDRSEIPYELKESFINSGVMHILAVSGLHVGIISLIIIAVLNFFRIPEKLRFLLTAVLLIFYVFLTGNSPSVVRATIMAIILIGALILQRKLNIYNSLAAAALIILLLDTRQLFHPGFQLSFIAVLSIVALYPKISSSFSIPISKKLKFVNKIIALFSVSFAAAIGTIPFTSYYFGKISVIGLIANMLIVPMMSLVLALGVAFTIFSFIQSSVSVLLAEVTKLLSSILLSTVDFFGTMKYSHINSMFSTETGLLYYFFVFFLFSMNKNNFLKRIIIGVLIILNIIVFCSLFNGYNLEILFFDVGQGDAIYIKTPQKKNILIDAGISNPNYDAAQRFIIPYFLKNNINKIDLMIISHPHSDHLGGVPTILRHLKVNRVIDAGGVDESIIYSEYKKLLDSLKINYNTKFRGDTIFVDEMIRIYVMHPTFEFSNEKNLNNHSIVLKILYKNVSLLLTGDVEAKYEVEISNIFKEFLKSEIFKCPHHGSNTSSSQIILDYVKPKYAIISVGQNNKYNHPSSEIIERLRNMGVDVFRTDHQGAVWFESDGNKIWNIDWRN